MKIISITAGWSETANLGDYNNVKPSLTVTAEMEEGDDPVMVQDKLIVKCREAVCNQIDQILELHGQAMLYYDGPLYQVFVSRSHKLVAVMPNQAERPYGFTALFANGSSVRHVRLERAQALAVSAAAEMDYRLFDCTQPPLQDIGALLVEIEAAWQKIADTAATQGPDPEGPDSFDDEDYPDDDKEEDDDWIEQEKDPPF